MKCKVTMFYVSGVVASSVDILQPLVLGCDTKNPKIVHLCLTSIQRLIQHQAISMVCPRLKEMLSRRATLRFLPIRFLDSPPLYDSCLCHCQTSNVQGKLRSAIMLFKIVSQMCGEAMKKVPLRPKSLEKKKV